MVALINYILIVSMSNATKESGKSIKGFFILLGIILFVGQGFVLLNKGIASQPNTSKIDSASKYPFSFRNTATAHGLFPAIAGIYGHGAAWGDVNGDGWIDLYVGTFNKDGNKPNLLFENNKGTFKLSTQTAPAISTRATGIVFADFDNDGDNELYVGSMPQLHNKAIPLTGCSLFKNEGNGKLTDISKGNGACPEAFGGRGVCVVDYNGDGLLDMLVGEDPVTGYNGSKTKSTRLFRNKGGLQFEDASKEAGLPTDQSGYGVAAADVNNDTFPDLFITSADNGNVLLINDGKGKFAESPGSREIFFFKNSGEANMVCGVTYCDVNRDGLLDIVIGPHYKKPWVEPQSVRLYLNMGIKNGQPIFKNITEQAGLKPLAMKAPHVEIQDFDNDGWPDIYTSIVKLRGENTYPVIAKHQGIVNGIPVFRDEAMGVNDYPTVSDKEVGAKGNTETFFNKILKEKKIIYMAPGPSGDYDNDGKIDLFLPNWWPESPSLLLHNETKGGNWLQVTIKGTGKVNRMGIGSRVKIYRKGMIGKPAGLIGCRDVAVGFGYASGQPAVTHFGLGKEVLVDVEITFPHLAGKTLRTGVKVNQKIEIGM